MRQRLYILAIAPIVMLGLETSQVQAACKNWIDNSNGQTCMPAWQRKLQARRLARQNQTRKKVVRRNKAALRKKPVRTAAKVIRPVRKPGNETVAAPPPTEVSPYSARRRPAQPARVTRRARSAAAEKNQRVARLQRTSPRRKKNLALAPAHIKPPVRNPALRPRKFTDTVWFEAVKQKAITISWKFKPDGTATKTMVVSIKWQPLPGNRLCLHNPDATDERNPRNKRCLSYRSQGDAVTLKPDKQHRGDSAQEFTLIPVRVR